MFSKLFVGLALCSFLSKGQAPLPVINDLKEIHGAYQE